MLGSFVLTSFVKNPFTDEAEFDLDLLIKQIPHVVKMLDNVIDKSEYPLKEQEEKAKTTRRMGIGITGLGSTLAMLKIRYDSTEGRALAGKIMDTINYFAYSASCNLAGTMGPFALFEERYLNSEFIRSQSSYSSYDWARVVSNIRQTGIRNSHLTSIAPTGTLSLLAGNVSSGIEPIFATSYTRKVRNTTEDDTTDMVVEDFAVAAYREYCEKNGFTYDPDNLPEYFVTSEDIDPVDHLKMQAELQKFVDSSISKTINVPKDYPFDKFKDIYMLGAKMGLKGCTTFRPNDNVKTVLSTGSEKPKAAAPCATTRRSYMLEGKTYMLKTPHTGTTHFITINDRGGIPYEMFVNSKDLTNVASLCAITKLASALLRKTCNPMNVVDELKDIYDPNGGYFANGKHYKSVAEHISDILLEHIGVTKKQQWSGATTCPQCGELSFVAEGGCPICKECGYTKCG